MRRVQPRRAQRVVAAAVVAASVLVLASCAPWGPGKAVACPSWVHFETPANAVDDSVAVFIGTVIEQDGTVHSMEVDMSAWAVEVDDVLAGDAVAAGERVRVVSTADPCSGTAVYEGGDPLDAVGDQLLIFTYAADGELSTLTPYQGVVPAPADGAVPEEWPAD